MLVLLCRSLSSFSCFSMMLMAGSIGMDVKSVLTSYDMIHSSGLILISFMLSRKSLLFWT